MTQTKPKKPLSPLTLSLCALFAALTAVLSQINVPIGPVPINLATFSVLCAGAVLGAKAGAVSQIIYVLLGICGVPVFAGFTAGIGRLTGPTGGYIIGYMLAPVVVGVISGGITPRNIANAVPYSNFRLTAAMLAGFLTYMTLGTLWYMRLTGVPLIPSLQVCVIPFLPGDALKITAAVVITRRLQRIAVA